MERLPYELLSVIFAHLSQEDIINLPFSVAGKGLSDKDLLSKFRTIDVWLDERSLETFNRAGTHPLLSDRIQSVCFHTDELAIISSLGFKHHHVSHNDLGDYGPQNFLHSETDQIEIPAGREMVVWRTGESVETQWDDKYRRYRALYEAQKNMRLQKKDLILLVKALRRLGRQPSIIVDDHYGFPSQSRFPRLLGDAWIEKCDRTHTHRRAGPQAFETILKSLVYCKLSLADFEIANTAPPGLTYQSGPLRYVPALHRIVGWRRCYRRDELISPISSAFFKNLRKFCLRSFFTLGREHNREFEGSPYISRQPNGYESTSANLQMSLKFVLSRCEMLEDLDIGFVNEAHLEHGLLGMPYLPLLNIFSDRWRRGAPLSPLRNLTLSNCQISQAELAGFLLRYSETLRTIHFTNLYITNGSRVNLFKILGGEMSLASAVFDGLHQEWYNTTWYTYQRTYTGEESVDHGAIYNSLTEKQSDFPERNFPYKVDAEASLQWLNGESDFNPWGTDSRHLRERRDSDGPH